MSIIYHDSLRLLFHGPQHELTNNIENYTDTDRAERDIRLVMEQASSTREQAIDALSRNGNDLVNAIMDLTV